MTATSTVTYGLYLSTHGLPETQKEVMGNKGTQGPKVGLSGLILAEPELLQAAPCCSVVVRAEHGDAGQGLGRRAQEKEEEDLP